MYCAIASRTGRSATTVPWLSRMPRVHRFATAPRLWLTKRIVRPVEATSLILPMHFFWNAASPTASTSSTNRISGLRCAATANASRKYMPLE